MKINPPMYIIRKHSIDYTDIYKTLKHADKYDKERNLWRIRNGRNPRK